MIFDFYDEDDVRLIQDAFTNKNVGFTSGTFDLFHTQHGHYLDACRRHCGHDGILIVGVDSDHLTRDRKGPTRPIVPESDRINAVSRTKGVAAAFILGTVADFGRAVELFKVKWIFKNQEYDKTKVLGANKPGVSLVYVPDVHRTGSTTDLIEKIIKSEQTIKKGKPYNRKP